MCDIYKSFIDREVFLAKEEQDILKLDLLQDIEEEFQICEEWKMCKHCSTFFNFFGIEIQDLHTRLIFFKKNNCGCKMI